MDGARQTCTGQKPSFLDRIASSRDEIFQHEHVANLEFIAVPVQAFALALVRQLLRLLLLPHCRPRGCRRTSAVDTGNTIDAAFNQVPELTLVDLHWRDCAPRVVPSGRFCQPSGLSALEGSSNLRR